MPNAHSPLLPPGKLPGGLLARLISQYRTPADESVVVRAHYGFDAAAISVDGAMLIVKSDPITFATEGAATYLVSVNANDIACMGGVARWLTVVALLPEAFTTEHLVESLFADLQNACMAEGVSLIGGHTEVTPGINRPLLIGTMLGTPGPSGLLKPGQARAGDDLYVTKWVGLEGTALLANERHDELASAIGSKAVVSAGALLTNPGISISEDARIALSTGTVTALHDPTEGGIATAIHELAEASGLGATVDHKAIPLRPDTRSICDHFSVDPFGLLSSGALLIAAIPDAESALRAAFADAHIPIQRIGNLREQNDGISIVTDGDKSPLPRYDSDELTRVLS